MVAAAPAHNRLAANPAARPGQQNKYDALIVCGGETKKTVPPFHFKLDLKYGLDYQPEPAVSVRGNPLS